MVPLFVCLCVSRCTRCHCELCSEVCGYTIFVSVFFFFQAEDGIRDLTVTGVQTCALPISQSYPGVSGVYYVARQQATLTATPNSGQNFYEYINSPFWLPGGLSTNPKTFYVMDDGTAINTTAYFSPTSSPVYTMTSAPTPRL